MTAGEQKVAEQKAAEQDRLAQDERLAQQERVAQQDRWSDAAIDREPVIGRRGMGRLLWAALVALAVVLLVTLPPLINVSRYQHRVAASISGSIGRPVRFDNISLHMLPWPGFTIENFVVYEDPSFGAEPALRANRVQARVRLSSLWRRRVEVSRITLESPTVNLVRNAAGYWNMQGVVTQAAQVRSAPTAQPKAGDAPRFPYIEASDARVNVKLDETKLPYALVDTEFALWLPSEQEWHLRLAGRPLRSDTDASDVGQLRVEATLSRRGLSTAQSPFTLSADWKPTPLGEASKLLLGRDAGWRGMASMDAKVSGTPGNMHVVTNVHVHDLRRAEFVPPEAMQLDAHCEGTAFGLGRQWSGVRCTLPTGGETSLLGTLPFGRTGAADKPAADVMEAEGDVPDVTDLRHAAGRVSLEKGSPGWVLRWMRLLSRRMPASIRTGGTFAATAETVDGAGWSGAIVCHCVLPVQADPEFRQGGPVGTVETAQHWLVLVRRDATTDAGAGETVHVDAAPEPETPGPEPGPYLVNSHAPDAITGTVGSQGMHLEYGSARLAREFARMVPALGDDLPTDFAGPVIAERQWGSRQTWTVAATAAAPRGRQRRRR